MQTNALPKQERIERRAQWESFSFAVAQIDEHTHVVNVTNHSHSDDTNHAYSCQFNHGDFRKCSCKHWEYRCETGEPCKHGQACMNAEPVQMALSHDVATDGGVTTEDTTESDREACEDCASLPGTFPCFDCYDPNEEYKTRVVK